MGLVKTRRRLAEDDSPHRAMRKQQRAKAGMKPSAVKCGARKGDDSIWSRGGFKPTRRDSR